MSPPVDCGRRILRYIRVSRLERELDMSLLNPSIHGNRLLPQVRGTVYDSEKLDLEFDPPLDKGIERAVRILCEADIETYESCEGGPGHSYPEPTIRFHGDRFEGFRALTIALQNGLAVRALRRVWTVIDGEPIGPTWEITFWDDRIISPDD